MPRMPLAPPLLRGFGVCLRLNPTLTVDASVCAALVYLLSRNICVLLFPENVEINFWL